MADLGGAVANYFCLDISRSQLRIYSNYAKSKGYPVHAVQGDTQLLPVRSTAVDLIFCLETLEHLESDARALSEIPRVLSVDRSLVISVPYAERLSKR